jgi:hypothetical protein
MNDAPRSAQEQRREVRRAADGAVRVWFDDPQPFEIRGRLMDVSNSGFRMSHDCTGLPAGRIVEFSHVEAGGRARVIWNRIVGDRVETGFFVVAGRE